MSSRKTQADNEVGGHLSSLTVKTIRRRSRLLQTAANLHSFRRQRPSSPYLAQLRPSTHTDSTSRQGKEDEEEKRPRKNDKGRRQLDSWHCRVVGSWVIKLLAKQTKLQSAGLLGNVKDQWGGRHSTVCEKMASIVLRLRELLIESHPASNTRAEAFGKKETSIARSSSSPS